MSMLVLISPMLCVAGCRQAADTKHHDRPTPVALTREQCEIIKIAERFVNENGYAKDPPTGDRSRIEWELGDDPSQLERVLEMRHDRLKPHAYGLLLGVPGDPLAWTVVFEYSDRLIELVRITEGKPREQPSGAVVRAKLDPSPKAVKAHTPIFLSAVARLPSPEQVAAYCVAVERNP
jgi:hypothetical protein